MLAATAEVAVMARAMDEAAALAVVAVKPVDKSADELDKELDKYHAEAMQTWRTFVACVKWVTARTSLACLLAGNQFG
ncbi:hypothetical protein QYF36_010809 [Acer negundo]|nr:hypothetical protein QYF36_010809 [Acer negundo]